MKKIVYEIIVEYGVLAMVIGIMSAFINGTKGVLEYLKQALISALVIVPIGILMVKYDIDIYIQYFVIILASPISIKIYNGIQKIGKRFEEDPEDCIKEICKRIKK